MGRIMKRDLEMIQDRKSWPQAVLPLKRYPEQGSLPEVGLLGYIDGFLVFLPGLNIYGEMPGFDPNNQFVVTDPQVQLINEGWMVD